MKRSTNRPTRYNRYELAGRREVEVADYTVKDFGRQIIKRVVTTLTYDEQCPFCGTLDPKRHSVHWDGKDYVKCPVKIGYIEGKPIFFFSRRKR